MNKEIEQGVENVRGVVKATTLGSGFVGQGLMDVKSSEKTIEDAINDFREKNRNTPFANLSDHEIIEYLKKESVGEDNQEDEWEPVDMVNHPPHYKNHVSGIECIEITRWMNFNLGNAFKYIYRRHDKGEVLQNLEKAFWYLCDESNRTAQTKITFENHYDYQRYFINLMKIVETEPEISIKELFFNIGYAQLSDNPKMFLDEAAKQVSLQIEYLKKESANV